MTAIQDHMIYMIVVEHPKGDYVPERDVADLDRATTIKDIANGEYEGVKQVLRFNPVEHTCDDVTSEIALAVSEIWDSEGEPLFDWQRDFIEQTIGIEAAHSFPRAA
ncbi:MAG: hypothetical protein J0G95_10975 [Rhizobiales bacterium]|nr:hypothetical protein [Hyphomicrobiales bacterium]